MSKQADQAQVFAAFALPIVLVAVAGWFAWNQTWSHAEGELSRTADGATELADRVFSSAVLAARLTNTLLTGVPDDELQQSEAIYHRRVAEIMAELPGSNMISVSDREGILTLMSGRYPATRVSVADREWVKALQASDPPEVHVGPLSKGRVVGLPFFSISISRTESGNDIPPGVYEGNITVSLDPHEIARELRTTTQEDADVISLVRQDGEILTSTRGNWVEAPRVPTTSPLLTSIEQGATRGIYEGQSLGLRDGLPLGRGILIAFKQVGDLPVYATVSRTPMAIITPWLRTMAALLAVGLPTSLALGLLSLASLRRRNALGKREAELRAAFENASTGTALVDRKTSRILKVNRRLCEISGRDASELIGSSMDRLLQACAEAPEAPPSGETSAAIGLNRLERPDGSIRWIELGTAPVTSPRIDDPSLVVATLHDITERKESEERQILLAREVDHRAKNVLAIVQALVRMERNSGASEYVARVEGRIRALARAHELLAKDGWQGATLESLVHDELAAYRKGSEVTVDGSAVVMSSAAVQPLSIVLHELATNAAKHGALAQPVGSLSVSWHFHRPTGGLELLWIEETGPKVHPRSGHGGSGLKIIRGSVDQLDGEIAFDWRETGLSCRIVLPPAALTKGTETQALNTNVAPRNAARGKTKDFHGVRVLLAEDEGVVATDIKELLEGIGCEVIGPAHSLEEARRLAEVESGRLGFAIFNVNLKGVVSIGLARELDRRGVGILLVTGYSEIPEKDKNDSWVTLRKPVSEADVVAALQDTGAQARKERRHSSPGCLTAEGPRTSKDGGI